MMTGLSEGDASCDSEADWLRFALVYVARVSGIDIWRAISPELDEIEGWKRSTGKLDKASADCERTKVDAEEAEPVD